VPLPKIITPEYELELPSTGKKIKYRPFLVKEEKILLLALESKDRVQITNAMKQILKGCVLTRGIKIEELPSFDIEYIFLNVRGKSVGEIIELIITCEDDEETKVPVEIGIDEIKVQKDPDHSRDIDLGGGITLRMKYPSLDDFINNNFEIKADEKSVENFNESLEIIASCMDVVFTKEDSWSATDCSKEELFEYIESMDTKQYKMIEKFFKTIPSLSHEFVVINPKTKKENKVKLEGLTSFFT
jgi:hypothetical protein